MKINWYAVVLMLLCVLTACGEDVETAIIGSWEEETLPQDFQFYQDGRVELNDRKYEEYKGIYAMTDGKTLTCEFERFSNPVVRTAKIKGDKLILTDKNGNEEIYRRK